MSLEDLLKAAGSHNLGDVPEPNIDSRNRDLPRHRWPVTSYGNAFVGQLLILAAITGAASLTKCVLFGAAFLGLWSAYNLLLWRRRHSNFKDWSDSFSSTLREGRWDAKENETRLSKKFLLPYLAVNFLSFLILSASGSHGIMKLIVGSLSIATLVRSKLQSTPSWQTMLLVCGMFISSEGVHSLLVAEDFEKYFTFGSEAGILKYILDPLPDMPFNLPNKVVLMTAVGVIVTTSLYWNTKLRIIQNIVPEILCAIWVMKLIPIGSEMSSSELAIGGGVCTFLIVLFILLEKNIEGWKISGGFLAIILTVISLTVIMISLDVVGPNLNSLVGNNDIQELKHIEWEEYDKDCHRTAWSSKSLAETQLKCFDKYAKENATAVQWKGRIMLLKSYDILRYSNGDIQDVSFEITANILSSATNSEKGWHFLQSDSSDVKAIVNILLSTTQFGPHRTQEKQKLIDYILSFRNGDKIEFHGILGGKTVGAIRPDIVDVQMIKCVACFDADYTEFTLNSNSAADFAYSHWEMFRLYLKE